MKKNLLFVINNLNCGGAEKALVSLLETLDYSKYKVDLYLFKHEGIFMSKIPREVNIIEEPKFYKYFDMSTKKAILELIKMRKFKIAIARVLSVWCFRTSDNSAIAEQRVWKYLRTAMTKLRGEYDAAIGYLEKDPVYFCIDKVNAKVRIGWIHNDYEQLGMNKKIDDKYFRKIDYIFTVSDKCGDVLRRVFPQYENKIKVMNNIVSEGIIRKLSKEEVNDITFNKEDINIVSVGRLNYQKGFEMAIEACSILVNKGYNIKWNIVGEGEERGKLEELINKHKVNSNFKLLGIRENPYKYIKNSDIYVQPSRFEGKSIAIDEAKILCKPIVVTNFSTAKDQIINNKNGIISEMDSISLANEIERIICNIQLRKKIISNLSNEKIGNENEINILYEVI